MRSLEAQEQKRKSDMQTKNKVFISNSPFTHNITLKSFKSRFFKIVPLKKIHFCSTLYNDTADESLIQDLICFGKKDKTGKQPFFSLCKVLKDNYRLLTAASQRSNQRNFFLMSPTLLSEETLRRKKMIILCCGVVMYFLTSMSKILIPGTVFNDLQRAGLDVKSISALGAFYMYAYAASQLLAGIFSDRYGGVRILLIGSSMFTAGTLGFPFSENIYLMYFFRLLTGFGAGTVFLGIAKLLADLFSAKFALAMGTALVCGYIGPTAGTMIVFLINAVGWQWAMAIPGVIALTVLAVIVIFMKGTIRPVTRGQSLAPLKAVARNSKMWLLWLTSSVVFAAYYVVLAQIGQKSISDFGGISPEKAATCIMIMTIMVAVNNMGVSLAVKLCGNRRKVVTVAGIVCTMAGGILGWCTMKYGFGLAGILGAFFLIALPAGYFPLFSVIVKDMAPPEYTGLAVALLNFMAFVFIALFQNISGRILQGFTAVNGVFPPDAYSAVFLFIAIAAVPAVISSFLVPETIKNRS